MADKVDEIELREALANRLREWKKSADALERTFEFPDFKTAMEFVNGVAEKAELYGHHPDITINYNKVKFSLTSHDAGGITRRDLTLAGAIQEIAPRYAERKTA